MKRLTYLLAVLFLATASALAQRQSFEGYIEAGDRAAAQDDFYNAYRLYDIATQFRDARGYAANVGDVHYKAGVAAYQATAYGVAKEQLLKLQELPAAANYPLLKYYLAQSNFRQGEYDKAAVLFQDFLDGEPTADTTYRSAAQAQINDADWAIDAMSRADTTTLTHLPEGINSRESDFMYVVGRGAERYFSSNRFVYRNDTLVPKRNLSRIMRQTGVATAEALPATVNLTDRSVAHTSFNADMTQVYYTVCDFRDYDDLICDLYRATVGEDGNWSNPEKLSLNVTGATTTQPSVGFDAADGREYLFFASDRSGSLGGLDLYRASIAEDGTLGTPEHLEYLSTPGEDATPFWYAPRQTLYFSTDGRFTFGGLDIYRAYRVDGAFRRPVNLGHPVNSSADEAYYSRFEATDAAYVSSRRPSPEALFYTDEREVCCYEIYQFPPDPRIDLRALTFNKLTREELSGATVALYEMTDTGPVLVEEITNPTGHEFDFLVLPGRRYELRASKDGFTRDLDAFDLTDPEFDGVPFIERRLYLNPQIKLDVFTFNNQDSSELSGATVRLYEVAEDESRTLVEEVDNPGAHDFHFDLEVGKRYAIVGERPGFGSANDEVDLRNYTPDLGNPIRRDLYLGQSLEVYVIDGWTDEPLDSATIRQLGPNGTVIGTKTNLEGNDFYYTVNLNQPLVLNTRRSGYYERTDTLQFSEQDLIDNDGKLVYYVPLFQDDPGRLLPFQVYFDNDYPNPRTTRETTDRTYPQTYFPYLEREEEYRQEYQASLSEEEAFLAAGAMEQFFDEQVKVGYRRLQRFAEALLVHARNGGSFVVQLRGFASPRAATEYNRRLSARRNVSVRNFFQTYADGALAPYISSNGKERQISFSDAALGESTADTQKISDRLDRPAESIYSVVASLERRVELGRAVEQKK